MIGVTTYRGRFIQAVLWGIISSILSTGVVITLSRFQWLIDYEGIYFFCTIFIGLVLIFVITNHLSLRNITTFANQWVADLRVRLQQAVLNSEWSDFQKKGRSYFHNLLTDDVQKVEDFAQQAPLLVTNLVKVILLLSYMVVFFPVATSLFMLMMTLLLVIIWLLQRRSEAHHCRTRSQRVVTTQHILDSVNGFRELKVNPERCCYFSKQYMVPGIHKLHQYQTRSWLWDQQIISTFWLGFYLLIGVSLMFLYQQSSEQTLSFIILMMMVVSPLSMLVMSLSQGMAASVAYEHIQQFTQQRVSIPSKDRFFLDGQPIHLSTVSYQYPRDISGSGFALKKIEAIFLPGQLTFIIGENGSGKSSLMAILTTLTVPDHGSLRIGGVKLTPDDYSSWQSSLSVIYQNPYVFSENLIFEFKKKGAVFQRYMALFHLQDKFSLKDGQFIGVEQLSFGQKKRLSLVCSLMEDKPIYIFDEWAADQDPYFRKLFYEYILPDLKNQGKVVIAITHDPDWFSLADQIIEMTQGQAILRPVSEF
ncbi:ATP-binding cassette domain-containing protein [uncultured Shewanella sp.]|uniref:ATP-binding cassette domain-containing protein n=1 Tax=uncultured Shewanella sp. TaxID=173975 RepID=UPI0026103C31|nr:ATP-binding cassette domain-containing protein [uncultured Shewanella sp.]